MTDCLDNAEHMTLKEFVEVTTDEEIQKIILTDEEILDFIDEFKE